MFIRTTGGGGGGGGGGNAFTVIQCDAGTDPVATGPTDTLTLTGTQIVTTGDSTTDTVTYSIAAGAITNTEVNASAAIAYSKLNLTGSIVNADINASAAIAFSKLAALSSANILVGSAGNVATSVAMSGDITITNAGVTAIGSGKIVNAQINASAAIDFSKLAALSSANILVGSAGNVATAVAVTGDVTISNVGVTAIGSGKIVDAQINASAAIAYSKLASMATGNILAGNGGTPTSVTMSGGATIGNTGVVTLGNTAVTGQALTGWATAAGPISATDTILQGFGKAVTGPASSTNLAIPLWNSTTGHLLQNVSTMVGSTNGDVQLGAAGVTTLQQIFTPAGSGGNNSCDLNIQGGNGAGGAGNGRASDVGLIAGGTASTSTTSRPGNVAITAGSASNASNNSNGGSITATPGTCAGTGVAGAFNSAGRTRLARTSAAGTTTITYVTAFHAVTGTGSAVTLTLPDATKYGVGGVLVIKDEGGGANANNITINRAGSDTIDGGTSATINTNYGTVRLYSDGAAHWFIW